MGTPTYLGVGQPTTSGGYLAASAPAYASAPTADPKASTCDDCPVDSEAIDSGNIAIVIPHGACND
ncbi:MAG: hypothetical protein QM831_11895 [Kofleriaceae bacterium]